VIESPQKTERKKKKTDPKRRQPNTKKMDGMNLLLDSKSKKMGETEK